MDLLGWKLPKEFSFETFKNINWQNNTSYCSWNCWGWRRILINDWLDQRWWDRSLVSAAGPVVTPKQLERQKQHERRHQRCHQAMTLVGCWTEWPMLGRLQLAASQAFSSCLPYYQLSLLSDIRRQRPNLLYFQTLSELSHDGLALLELKPWLLWKTSILRLTPPGKTSELCFVRLVQKSQRMKATAGACA